MKQSIKWITGIFIGILFFAFIVSVSSKPPALSRVISSIIKPSGLKGINGLMRSTSRSTATTSPSSWKGVNLPLKLDSIPGIGKLVSQSNFDRAGAVGANVIRLGVYTDPNRVSGGAYSTFFDSQGNVIPLPTSPGIADLNTAINMAAKDNMKVIVDMMTMPGDAKGRIWTNQADWDNFKNLWVAIATAVKDNPNVVAFDLMNEPNPFSQENAIDQANENRQLSAGTWTMPASWVGTPHDYVYELTAIAEAIRAEDPSRTLAVQPIHGDPTNFQYLTPLPLDNIVYSLHMYIPDNLTAIGQKAFTERGAQGKAFVYPADESKITAAFAPVLAFQQKYNVPIWVGEFGIEDKAIFGDQFPSGTSNKYNGSCWLSSVMQKMDANHWGWTFWDFWTGGRIPLSANDPRYQALHADMTTGVVPNFCNNPPVLSDTTTAALPVIH
jgi:Cellulase (glycosyl hydrolase family 5)